MTDQPVSEATFKYTPQLILLITAVIMSSSMQSLDGTIANVALPHIEGTMSATFDQVAWVITSYVVAAAICTPLTGFVVSRFGRKRVLMASLIGFVGASVFCGAAQTLSEIVTFRLLQGAAGAFLLPLSQSILLDIYPKERHGTAMATWNAGVMVAPVLGPTMGGYLTDAFSWRWVFYVNVPIGLFCILGIAAFLTESKRETKVQLDVMGFAFLGTAIGALQLMLDRGTMLDWFSSTEIIIETYLAVLAGYLFVVHMCTAPKPFLNRASFKDRNYVLGMIMAFGSFLFMFASNAMTPMLLQNLLGYPAFDAGIVMLPRGFLGIISTVAAGRLLRFMDARVMTIGGLTMMAMSTWQMAGFTPQVGPHEVFWYGMIGGFGSGFVFTPLTVVIFATLDPKLRTEASSLFGLMRSMGGGIGMSVVATIIARLVQTNHSNIAEHLTPYNPVLRMAGDMASQVPAAAMMLDMEVNRQASMIAYLDVFILLTYLMGILGVLVLFARTSGSKAQVKPDPAAMEA